MSGKFVRALQSPACYPHPVTDIRLLETHISWVLLTGDYAYKIKKPVNFGFLDFSTLEKRRRCCEEELRLNSRFSESLYLEVVPICGSVERPRVNGEGEPFEYAVRMRQFPQDCLLDKLAEAGALDTELVRALARKLADFHLRVAARLGVDEAGLGTREAVAEAALENFRQIEPLEREDAVRRELAALRHWTGDRIAELGQLMDARRGQGFVRECHGDLHLANIARLEGEPVFFDCIEFNRSLRWIDTLSELAFLLMDMEEKEIGAAANRLLNIYLEYTGDYAGLRLLPFYKVYRAMVRAKVMLLRAASGDLKRDEEARVHGEYRRYLRLATGYCSSARPFLAIMHGVSGTGKSTAAAAVAAETGAIRIRSDVERKRLFGLPPDAPSAEEKRFELYSREASVRTRESMLAIARDLLAQRCPVIADATFIAAEWREPFMALAAELGVPFVILDCRAPPDVIEARLQRREASRRGASDAGLEVMRSQLEHAEPFDSAEQAHVVIVDTEATVNARGLLEYLNQRSA